MVVETRGTSLRRGPFIRRVKFRRWEERATSFGVGRHTSHGLSRRGGTDETSEVGLRIGKIADRVWDAEVVVVVVVRGELRGG